MSIELVCPAGTPAALRAGVEAGAHAVYCGFRDETNARNFPGLNFSAQELREGVRFAHERGAKVLAAVNTFARAGAFEPWAQALANAEEAKADAVILADIAVLDYCAAKHPGLRIHLSVQAAAATPEAIGFYAETFGVKRVVLPRVLSVEEIAALNQAIKIETEVFVFGGLCPMAEGRCALSSYATGRSPNMSGVCSPPEAVAYSEDRRGTAATLGGFTINRFQPSEQAGYPTLCKGRFVAGGKTSYLFEDPTSLNAAGLIASLKAAGVTALKIEGRQRGKGYVAEVVKMFRRAVDAIEAGRPPLEAERALQAFVEGGRQTSGAYKKSWR
ncbi:MAG: peptidase U32 family protein [Rhodomicrobium sp.]